MEMLRRKYVEHKRMLMFVMMSTFLWGLLSHGYCFFEYSFSHDSLIELHGAVFGNGLKISAGRVFAPFYRAMVRSDVTLPWMIGMLSLLWLGLSVFLTVRIFDIRSKVLAFLTAGIFTSNITVSATAATYLHDLDCYMFSLLCAVGTVCCWKFFRRGLLPGAVLLAVSIGMYQGFLSTAITLIMFVCILRLMEGGSFRAVFSEGIRAIVMILLGGILYAVSLKGIQKLSNVALLSENYNSMDRILWLTPDWIRILVRQSYEDWFSRLTNPANVYPGGLIRWIVAILTVIGATALLVWLLDKKTGIAEKLLCIALLVLLPFGMNLIYLLNLGNVHDLMVFAIWLFYLFVLLLCRWLVQRMGENAWCSRPDIRKWISATTVILVAVVFYGNMQFANGMYLKKDLEQSAYLSYMTRVLGRVEATEGYKIGDTEVFISGVPENLNEMPKGFDIYAEVTGLQRSDLLWFGTRQRYQTLLDYLLGVPMLLADQETWDAFQENPEIAQMPCYPDEGCVRMIDGILVVKLGNQ